MSDTTNNFFLRIVGDVHGHYDKYVELVKDVPYSIQLGDLGFDYRCLDKLDGTRNRCIGGNHDNYSKYGTQIFIKMQTPHWLGDYGIYEIPDFGEIFFLRGGYSIDHLYRKEGRNWWRDEQLSYSLMNKALEFYQEKKPDFVVSHECPSEVLEFSGMGMKEWDGMPIEPSMTSKLLDEMLSSHAPKHWYFGHHHKLWQGEFKGTSFMCLPELGYVDLDSKKNIIGTGVNPAKKES